MPEGMNQNQKSREQIKLEQAREDPERLADYLARHPDPIILPENLREAGPEIAEFKTMVASFESTHPLAELESIVDLSVELATVFEFAREISYTPEQLEYSLRHVTKVEPVYAENQRKKIAAAKAIVLSPEDEAKFELREAAKRDLVPITAKLNSLKKETNISVVKHDELKERYKRLAKALGSINKKINPNSLNHS